MTDLPDLSDISGKQDDHVSLTRGWAQNLVQYALCVLFNALQGSLGSSAWLWWASCLELSKRFRETGLQQDAGEFHPLHTCG